MRKKGLPPYLIRKTRFSLSATKMIALTFAGIIALGTLLLAMPVSSSNGSSCGFLTALFTATSATCVTGLTMGDTFTMWSLFGQIVILCLIEVGGLGFMSVGTMVYFLLRKKIGLRQRILIAQALSLDDLQGVVQIQKRVLLGSLSVQMLGAAVLTVRFWPEFGFSQSLYWGVFHSISAFCNAGFDVFGSVAPGMSLVTFNTDPVILITLMVLITVGGLGFFVWEEVATVRRFRKYSVYTKLVLSMSAALLLAGAGVFLLTEWNNPETLGTMPAGQKILNAFFQSVTLRTAGFFSFDQGGLTDTGKALSVIWMLIGGSSGSTAGGMKTVTVLVLLLFLWNSARGRKTIHVFRKSVPEEKVINAMTITTVMIGLTFLGAILVTATSAVGFLDALFESASALGTVGITTGITTELSVFSKLLIILFMYFGRVGVLTISLGFLMGDEAKERFRYASTNLLIG